MGEVSQMLHPVPDAKPNRSLANIASIVAAATLISKLIGLVRQQAIAAAFAVGPVGDAYGLSYVIPGFLLVLLGGINGPFHSAIVSVVTKRKREDIAPLIETVTTVVGMGLLMVTIVIILFADPLLGLIQGLDNTAAGVATREIVVIQLRIMAPMALFAGLIGIGFGTLNATDQYWLPSISPLLSSVTVLIGLGGLFLAVGKNITEPEYAVLGGVVLAASTLAGAAAQWLLQVPTLWKENLWRLRARFDFQITILLGKWSFKLLPWRLETNRKFQVTLPLGFGMLTLAQKILHQPLRKAINPKMRFSFKDPGARDVLKVLGPATFSSGMMQINVATDLAFATAIPGTISALGYANLLVQTPLGIVSNIILVPFLPIFSRLATPNHWPDLKVRIRQSLLFVALTMLPLGALMITLAQPIVRIIYERGAFDEAAVGVVTPVLIAYGVGMFVYLGRDVIVRVFYALGDGETPFRISAANILLNVLLDYVLINLLGAPGLVIATVGVNVVSMVVMLVLLDRKIDGLPWLDWTRPVALLILASLISGAAALGVRLGLEHWMGTQGFFVNLLILCLAGAVGVGIFAATAIALQIPEAHQLIQRLRSRFGR